MIAILTSIKLQYKLSNKMRVQATNKKSLCNNVRKNILTLLTASLLITHKLLEKASTVQNMRNLIYNYWNRAKKNLVKNFFSN